MNISVCGTLPVGTAILSADGSSGSLMMSRVEARAFGNRMIWFVRKTNPCQVLCRLVVD